MAKVGEILKHKDRGLSVEEARKAMLDAGEAPSGLVRPGSVAPVPAVAAAAAETSPPDAVAVTVVRDATADALEPEFAEEAATTEVEKPAVAAPVLAPVPAVAEPPKVERVETGQFTGEIRQEKGKWVAEIVYKSGSGTERFIADSKNELMLALLAGKGHATLRVKEAVRREKLGGPKLDQAYPLPEDITTDDFAAMPEKQQDAMLYTIASQQTLLFRDAHPEFYPTPKNAETISQYLGAHRLPITLRNLEHAFEDLTDTNELETRPEPTAPVASSLPVPVAAPVAENTAPAVAAPVPVPTVAAATATPAVTVRKRGTTGLQPGQSSSPSDLGAERKSRDLSEAELRKLPLSELKRIADQDRRSRSGAQR